MRQNEKKLELKLYADGLWKQAISKSTLQEQRDMEHFKSEFRKTLDLQTAAKIIVALEMLNQKLNLKD